MHKPFTSFALFSVLAVSLSVSSLAAEETDSDLSALPDDQLLAELRNLEESLAEAESEGTEEAPPAGYVGGFLGYDSDFGATLGLTARFDPFLAQGETLRLSAEKGEEGARAGVELRNHILFDGTPALYLGLDWQEREADDHFDFGHESKAIRLGLSWQSEASGTTGIYALYARDEVSEVGASASSLILADLGEVSKHGIGFGWRKTFGTEADATAVSVKLNGEIGQISNDTDYRRLELSTGLRHDVNAGFSLRAEFKAGAYSTSGGNSRITDRFHADSNLVRGFEHAGFGPRDLGSPGQSALGGERYTALRLDLERKAAFGLPDSVRVGLFLDAGALWQTPHSLAVDQGKDIRSAAGLSLSADFDQAELRLEFAAPIAKEAQDETRVVSLRLATKF